MKISTLELAAFINQLPDAYYFEDTADALWDSILVSEGKSYRAADPSCMVEPKKFLGSGHFCCNDEKIDPLHLNGKMLMPVLNKWLADRTSKVCAFRIPNDKAEQVLAYLKGLGIEPV